MDAKNALSRMRSAFSGLSMRRKLATMVLMVLFAGVITSGGDDPQESQMAQNESAGDLDDYIRLFEKTHESPEQPEADEVVADAGDNPDSAYPISHSLEIEGAPATGSATESETGSTIRLTGTIYPLQ